MSIIVDHSTHFKNIGQSAGPSDFKTDQSSRWQRNSDQTTDIQTNFNECETLDPPTNPTPQSTYDLKIWFSKYNELKDRLKLRLNRGTKLKNSRIRNIRKWKQKWRT